MSGVEKTALPLTVKFDQSVGTFGRIASVRFLRERVEQGPVRAVVTTAYEIYFADLTSTDPDQDTQLRSQIRIYAVLNVKTVCQPITPTKPARYTSWAGSTLWRNVLIVLVRFILNMNTV